MTTGNVLYLLMSIGVFGPFSAVLGYESWMQSRTETKVPEPHRESQEKLAA